MTTPTGIIFDDPRPKPLSTAGLPQAGCYYQFYTTGTLTYANVYADGALTTPLSQTPVTGGTTADGFGRCAPMYMDPSVIYRVQLYNAANQLLEDTDPYVVPGVPSALVIQTIVNFRTQQEINAGVTPVQYQYPAYNAFRYMTAAQVTDVINGTETQDVTTPLQTLFSLCSSQGQIGIMPSGIYKISSALTWAGGAKGGGINMAVGFGGGSYPDSQILVTGTGYTALTMSGIINTLKICIGGTGNACNGLQLGTSAATTIVEQSFLEDIRVYNLAGFGVECNDMFDTWIGTCSVQLCGTLTAVAGGSLYAFSMNSVTPGDQCNMTIVDRLQVEQANSRAINIPLSGALSCQFNAIHSERAIWDGTNPTHILGGDSCTYVTSYITSTTTALVSLVGSNCYYGRMRVAGGNVQLNGSVNVTYQGNRIDNMTCANLTALSGSLTPFDIYDSSISGTLFTNGQAAGVIRVNFSTIAGVNMTGGSAQFNDCSLTGVWTSSGNPTVDCRGCQINSLPNTALALLTNCTVANSATLGNNQVIRAWQTTFSAALTMTASNGSVLFGYGCTFNGNLVGSGGGNAGVLDMGCNGAFGITVGTDWFGAPTNLPAALSGWAVGTVRKNLTAAATTYAFSICTTGSNSGAGTWTNSVLP